MRFFTLFLAFLSLTIHWFGAQAQPAELVIQSGHYDDINGLAFSPDGQTLASAADDASIIIWDISTGKEFRKLKGHKKSVFSVLFSRDGKILISGGNRLDQELIFWDWKSGQLLHRIPKAHSNAIESMALSQDGKLLVTSTYQELKVWDTQTYEMLFEISGARKGYQEKLLKHTVKAITFSPDDKTMALGTANKDLLLFSVPDFQLIYNLDLSGTDAEARAIAFNSNGKLLYHTSSMGKIVQRNSKTGELIKEIEGMGTGSPCPCLFRPDLKTAFTGCGGRASTQFVESGKLQFKEEIFASCRAASYNPQSSILAVAGITPEQTHTIKLFDANNGRLIRSLEGYPGKITSLAFSHDDLRLASGSRESPTRIWSLASTAGIKNFLEGTFSKNGDIYSTVAFSKDDQIIYNGTQSAVFMWDSETAVLKQRIFERIKESKSLVISPNGQQIVYNSARIKTMDAQTGEVQQDLGAARTMTRSVAISPDGQTIFGGGYQEIKKWNAQSYEELEPLTIDAYAWEMALSPDNQFLALREGSYLKIRNAKDGTLIHEVKGFQESCPAFSPDGQFLASARGDTIMLRNTHNYELIQKLIGHDDQVQAIVFSHDSKIMASGSDDTSIKLWDVKTGKLLVTLLALHDEDFIITTPDLYYMTTKDGLKGVAFRVGDKIFPFDQFDLQYNRPDKVLERIGYASSEVLDVLKRAYQKRLRRLNFNEQMFNQDFHLPQLRLLTENLPPSINQKQFTLEFEATDSKYPLDRLQIFVNDNPIYGSLGRDYRKKKTQKIKDKIELELSNGLNQIQISVINAKGVESLRESFQINYTGEARPSTLYLFAIGVSRYQSDKMNLQFADKDARDLVRMLNSPENLKKYREIIIDTIFNEEATLPNILALKQSLAQTQIDDQVIFFIACHGLLDEELDYYLATHDIDFKDPAQKGLAYETLEGLLDGIPARRKVLFMDACHSGEIDKYDELAFSETTNDGQITARGFGQTGGTGKGTGGKEGKEDQEEIPPIEEDEQVGALDLDFDIGEVQQVGLENSFEVMKEVFADLRRGTGATVISSAGGLEYALEGDIWQNGVFTYCFLSGLKTRQADLDNDGKVKLSELQKYLQSEVSKLTDGRQQPTSRVENIQNDFVIW